MTQASNRFDGLFTAVALLLFTTSLAIAQTTGTILGQITDPTGAVVANASVAIENTGTGLQRSANTTAEGTFLVTSLPVGGYKVTVRQPGFRPFTRTGITLEVAQNARVDVQLQVGETTESVTVSSAASTVDTQSATVGLTVDNQRLSSLPLNGRNVLSLMQLLPGVGRSSFPTTVTFSRRGPIVNVSGARNTENNFMLDGSTMVGAMENAGLNLPSPDTMQEFKVLTNSFSAEYGRSAGAVVLAVTKSGTNEIHGDLWEFLRNDALNARNFFAASKPFLRQNQFGASAGGPLVRNKIFWFGSYQGLRIREQQLVTGFPATPAERNGEFTRAITDPTTNQPFAGNRIPLSRFDPVSAKMMELYMDQPNQPDGRFLELRSLPRTGDQYTAKGDLQLTSADRVSLRYYRNQDLQSAAGTSKAVTVAGPQWSLTQDASVTHTRVLTSTLLNEFRMSYTRVEGLSAATSANRTPRELGAKYNQDGPIPLSPTTNISGRINIAPTSPLWEPEDHFQFDEKISWQHGKHSLKAGAWAMRIRHLIRQQFQVSGQFDFNGAFSRDAMADFLLGRANNALFGSLIQDDKRATNYHFFLQDDYKIRPRLTLNLGLRYELNLPWVQKYDQQALLRPGRQSEVVRGAPAALVYPGDSGVPRGLIGADRNNFAPRIGLAWDVFGDGRTSLRTAYGLFYTQQAGLISALVSLVPPFQVSLSQPSPPSFTDPWAGRPDPFPYVVDRNKPTFVFPLVIFTIAPDLRDGYLQQWNMNLQRELRPGLSVQAGYFGTMGHGLATLREANAAVFGAGATAQNVQSRRPFFPQYYSSIADIHSDANSSYHALQVRADKRFSKGYTVQLAYTLSKTIDERSQTRLGTATVQDPFNYRHGERGLADFDQRHVLALNGIWEIPFLRTGRGLTGTLLGGWNLNGILRLASGSPFNVVSGRDTALVGTGRGSGPQRPDVIGDPKLDPGRSHGDLVAAYFSPAAFAVPANGKFGNSGRNNLVGPGLAQADFGIYKRFAMPREWGYFEFRTEVFNATNRVNFNSPNASQNSPAFGRILGADDARIVQFALKYHF